MNEDIIHNAIENLRKTTGIDAFWRKDTQLDGYLELLMPGQKRNFVMEIKNEVRPHQVYQLENQQLKYKDFLVVANHIFPKVKEELRLMGIAYLEANGNIFLKKDNVFLFVDTNKHINPAKGKGNRAFTKTGLKVLFHLLQHKEHINLPQRELAKMADVGLGNIPQIIEGLKATGYLLLLNKNNYVWDKRRELLERWVEAYGTVLKPKLRKEHYTYQGDWKNIAFNNELTVWGGEPAADLLTNYLRPEKFTIYTKENRANLMKNYRLIPKQNGEIEVLEMFWKQNENEQTTPAIIVYADLLLEGGKRNKETAIKILNEYIQPNL